MIAICNMATMECYYHNVAKSTKTVTEGYLFWTKDNEYKYWKEYTGVAKIGVKLANSNVTIDGTEIKIYLPDAEILSIEIIDDSISETIVEDNSKKIVTSDVTETIGEAQESIRENIINSTNLLTSAQNRAKKLIENYVNKICEISDTKYTITWVNSNPTMEMQQ